jgi:amino acid transporter
MTMGSSSSAPRRELVRAIDWRGAFWVASGVPALVLFSIGGIAGTVGNVAFAIWAASMMMGFIQSFTYAEIAGLFPNKSGGASVYGAAAWLKYGKWIAPLSVWCNWIAWTPVLSLGSAIGAGYILGLMEPAPTAEAVQAAIAAATAAGSALDEAAAAASLMPLHNWTLGTITIGPVGMSFGWTFFIGALLMLLAFAIQHRGILGTAKVQTVVGVAILATMLIVGIAPLINGNFDSANFSPFVPLAVPYAPEPGAWNIAGWTLVFGGMFIAAWSTYGFETAICYTSEFKNPATDTFKAIFYSGLVCIVLFILVPFTFQGSLGLSGMLETGIVDGSGVAAAMANMVVGGAGTTIGFLFVIMIIASLILIIVTAMAGSSRTLYQGSVDGWLPKWLSIVNHHGAPTGAMWTDLVFNLFLLAIASTDALSYFFILAVSNCGYIVFNFLNLNAGWIHRMDAGHVKRPYRAPTIVLAAGTVLAFVNAMFMGAGAKVWNPLALWAGIIACALGIFFFLFRHYVQDKGKFPARMLEDLGIKDQNSLGEKKAGMLPYLTLVAGVAVVLISNWLFTF